MDARLKPWRTHRGKHPAKGWLRAIRETLGMSAAQLGRRLGITRQAVVDLERREVGGTTTLNALRKVADAMDCDLVYAIVPRRSLVETVELQAWRRAKADIDRVSHSMHLEAQDVPLEERERLIADTAAELLSRQPRAIWDL